MAALKAGRSWPVLQIKKWRFKEGKPAPSPRGRGKERAGTAGPLLIRSGILFPNATAPFSP